MSVAPGVLCSICMECFNKDDCVDSTSCGHIYHSTCIQNCLTRSKQCPKCHAKCRGTYKLVLDFDDSGDKASKQLEENFLVLQKDYPEVEINKQLKEEHRYLSLQVNARNKEISLLQEKIKRMEAQTPKQKRTRKRNSRTSF
ncbi:E3 ubiquitin-protein ligase RNF128-like [Glossina fuscipes]|uniref:E3 ubiquitin-protein ligase RNF128-like n=1 Tax=Glossina fuscipes TaxID=7396 RepID=A0A9C5ZJY2_9MUSC|nr:E3 ubiquitin-protein ligase RNF128-like [Glossina fuscipes]